MQNKTMLIPVVSRIYYNISTFVYILQKEFTYCAYQPKENRDFIFKG
ncbi:hypothetical protein QW060_03110 [Myroides ceti]|uniref:Ribosomal protein L32 n=1 Tax=Paenimyroides ceti TaxID=395087 RepID=A0ABT8CQ64_9FLAO|nr:hypothetical protein [Paenimyroides ceti]MDN3706111.1 hypothetical protein [Paenimyroides ceti]